MASTPKTNPNETITQFTADFLDEEQRKMNEYYDSQRQRPRNFSMDSAIAAVSAAVSDPASAADYNIISSQFTIPEGYHDFTGKGTMLADHAGDFNEIPSDIAREIMANSSTTASLLPEVEEDDLLPLLKKKAKEALSERDKKRRKKEGGRKSRKKRTRKTKRRKRSRKKGTRRSRKKRRKKKKQLNFSP